MDVRNIQPLNFTVFIEFGLLVAFTSEHISKGRIVPSRIVDFTILFCLGVSNALGTQVTNVLHHHFILFAAGAQDTHFVLAASEQH